MEGTSQNPLQQLRGDFRNVLLLCLSINWSPHKKPVHCFTIRPPPASGFISSILYVHIRDGHTSISPGPHLAHQFFLFSLPLKKKKVTDMMNRMPHAWDLSRGWRKLRGVVQSGGGRIRARVSKTSSRKHSLVEKLKGGAENRVRTGLGDRRQTNVHPLCLLSITLFSMCLVYCKCEGLWIGELQGPASSNGHGNGLCCFTHTYIHC